MTGVLQLYRELYQRHGPQGWWPTKSKGYHESNATRSFSDSELLEICIGAILTQNTNWSNVEKALASLFEAGVMSVAALSQMDELALAQLIRSSGYFRQKARKLRIFAGHVLARHGSLKEMFAPMHSTNELREELLSLWGIGPETADSILVYAARRPSFVIDAYTKRVCAARGLCAPDIDYHTLQSFFHKQLPPDVKLFNEFHALLVAEGKLQGLKKKPISDTEHG